MLRRYFELPPFFIHDRELLQLLLSPAEKAEIQSTYDQLEKFQSLCKTLQENENNASWPFLHLMPFWNYIRVWDLIWDWILEAFLRVLLSLRRLF